MKFARNVFAPFTLTCAFWILSMCATPFFVVPLFLPERTWDFLPFALIMFFAAVLLLVLAEIITYFMRNFAAITITLGEDELTIERIGEKKIKIKYADVKYIDADIGTMSGKYRQYKYEKPKMELYGEKGKSLSIITCPSLLMMYHIKKKIPHAKFSRAVLWNLFVPVTFTVFYFILFAIVL